MPRTARVVVPGIPHHITQRGTRRFDVFRDEADRIEYLKLLLESCREHLLHIVAYCLMTNHVHYVAIPERTNSISKVFHRVQGTYSKRFNARHGFVGHLWQERPFSCLLDESHFWNAIRYVERNPVRAGLVSRAEDYRWSSARSHCRGEVDPFLELTPLKGGNVLDWRAWLTPSDDATFLKSIRECTALGRPFGTDQFIKEMSVRANRDFTLKKRGPKPKVLIDSAGGVSSTSPK